MFSNLPPDETNYFKRVEYGTVTASISMHCIGQVCYFGRYYSAKLSRPRKLELPVGTPVVVLGTQGADLVVERDEALS